MLAVRFGIKCKKKVLAKQNNAQKSASTIGKRLEEVEVVPLVLSLVSCKQHSSANVFINLHGGS